MKIFPPMYGSKLQVITNGYSDVVEKNENVEKTYRMNCYR